MTDQIKGRITAIKRLLPHFAKPCSHNNYPDTNGILTQVEIQCRRQCNKIVEKIYSTGLSHFLPFLFSCTKTNVDAWTKKQKKYVTAHRLNIYSITFINVQL